MDNPRGCQTRQAQLVEAAHYDLVEMRRFSPGFAVGRVLISPLYVMAVAWGCAQFVKDIGIGLLEPLERI